MLLACRPGEVFVRPIKLICLCGLLLGTCVARAQDGYLYGMQPGKAEAAVQKDVILLRNAEFMAKWSTVGGKLSAGRFRPRGTVDGELITRDLFSITLDNGRTLRGFSMRIARPPHIEELSPNQEAARLEEHFGGKRITVRLEDPDSGLSVIWSAELRDGGNYVRQGVSLQAARRTPIREVRLIDFWPRAPVARVEGTVKGSPVIYGSFFLGLEHPLSNCVLDKDGARCSITRQLPLQAGQTIKYSSVIGISPPGQMRRGFLNYVERARAHPYRPFLHYNSWFDIGYGNRYDQAGAVDAIQAFGEELHVKRGVKLDSFLFDDGWDNPRSLWSFDSGFPDGFTPVKAAAAKYGAAPGIWLSPWGGYDKAKEERMKYGGKEGFEMNKDGFALSGPKYFARFRDVTLKFIQLYGINQFKIDGTGNVNSVFPGSEFDSDFHAAINLIGEWRAVKPDIFVNLTTGTFPSPFWLLYADSIWRGGDDTGFAGVGSWREKWITYRDADTYTGIVKKGPLFPLNSLMLHGIVYARQAEHLSDDPDHGFTHEVHDYFGSGTQLQELYITHALMTDLDWDVLAEAANWSRDNSSTLADIHWIGGDPAKLEVYGWAAWSPVKGILTLRNPSNHPQSFSLDVGIAFELPPDAMRKFLARSGWKQDQQREPIPLAAGVPYTFQLQPFEVLNLEAVAAQ
jgi:hypothetical protein